MERVRYFYSANQFNIVMNFLSGNNFPLSDDKTVSNFVSLAWIIFAWAIKLLYFTSVVLGSLYFAKLTPEEAYKQSGVLAALWIEFLTPTIYLNLRRSNLRNLISKYNDILIDSEDLRKFVRSTGEPYQKGFRWYTYICLTAAFVWSAAALHKVPNNDNFTYVDFTVPAYLPGEPFGTNVFISGVFLQIMGATFINIGNISIDVYVIHFIAVLSAEYKFIRAQAAEALTIGQEKDRKSEESVIAALQTCVRHHATVIEIGEELTDMLAFHVGTTYIAYILKFCFLAFGIITFGSAVIEKVSYMMYFSGCMIQTHLICSSVQELLDESTSVTQDAFHGNWPAHSIAVKKIFSIMQTSNQMACRLTAYGIVDLNVPTLAVMLRKSYSVCLLLLEVD